MRPALSSDHRVIDGATAVQFQVKIQQMIEDPETLLIEWQRSREVEESRRDGCVAVPFCFDSDSVLPRSRDHCASSPKLMATCRCTGNV